MGFGCDSAGRLWVGSEGGGVAWMILAADNPKFVIYRMTDGLSSDQQRCFTEDRWGRIYIGTARGVDRLDLTTTQIKHSTPWRWVEEWRNHRRVHRRRRDFVGHTRRFVTAGA